MKEILIFAGTTEGRKLSEHLSACGVAHTLCVATEYGEIVLNSHPLAKVHRGRMNAEEMQQLMQCGIYGAVVDATHPYAQVVTENVKSAAEKTGLPYLRLLREMDTQEEQGEIHWFSSSEACAEALKATTGNLLLTTGSKELHKFCICEDVKKRLYVRVLPGMESLSICQEQGIVGKQIIAMQGPFSEELNLALLRQFHIAALVTKKSGVSGGYQEKIEAAKRAGIPVYVITNEAEETGNTFTQICEKLEEICKVNLQKSTPMEILLAGIGMGNKATLTREVEEAIGQADILLGAERMLEPYEPKIEKRPYYLAKQIVPYLKEIQMQQTGMEACKVVVLFSGDSGFYSGCQKLYRLLKEEVEAGELQATLRILPGISSVSYLAACTGEAYQDAQILSMHGKELWNLGKKIRHAKKTFLLMSGAKDVQKLGKVLTEEGLGSCKIFAGYQLSYKEQKVLELTPQECMKQTEEGLYTCLIVNPEAVARRVSHGAADEEFLREKVPMTKEEVREASICKLHLQKDSVVYDIGSGTGSIAIEMAGLSDEIKVYALEQKPEAVALIQKNKEKFGRENLTIVEAKAPEKLNELPTASHAFIGGSGGNLKEILTELYQINPNMRIVINAVSMETICEIKECLDAYQMKDTEVVQMQVSRAKQAGAYHLMRAENPVWICAFQFCE